MLVLQLQALILVWKQFLRGFVKIAELGIAGDFVLC